MEALIKTTIPTVSLNPNASLAIEAEKALGYSPYAESLGVQGPLGLALAKLNIDIFSTEKVEAYQEELREATINRIRPTIPRGTNAYNDIWRNIRWKEFAISEYKDVIPTFVLSKALEIKKAIPEVQFYVSALVVEAEIGDPFLLIKYGREAFYVEVWQESVFEATL